ncbi:MAG: substrate-binding domain-containing protein [Phototrophicales bacterium]|nr:substrate-binding domain-containing protein [Phototrophicales bacterium]
MRKSIFLLMTLVIFVMSIGVGSSVAQDDAPIKIGLMVDQSGLLTIYGIELELGFKLGLLYQSGVNPADFASVDEALAAVRIAGRPVEILVRDNGSVADVAQQQARELIENDGVELLVGAPSSTVTIGLQQVALEQEVMLFAAPGASPDVTGKFFNKNTFRVCRNTAQDAFALAAFATDLGSDWVIMATQNDFGLGSAAAFQAILGARGVNFVRDTILIPPDATDFTPYLNEAKNSGAQVLLPVYAGTASVTLFQQVASQGVNEVMTVIGAFNSNDIVAASDPSTIGSVAYIVYHYTFPETAANDWLVENHIALFNDVPDLFTECAFATAQALVNALEATGGDTLPDAMIPALEGMSFDGPKGTYYIRPSDHQVMVPMYIAQLTNLDNADSDFYDLLGIVSAFDTMPPCPFPFLGDADAAVREELSPRCELDADFMTMMMEMEMMPVETPAP